MFGEVIKMKMWQGLCCVMITGLVSVSCFEESLEEEASTGGSQPSANTFTVSSTDDVVWLGVYDRPTQSNAPAGEVGSGYVAYTLSGVGTGQAKKRMPSLKPSVISWSQHRYTFAARLLPEVKNDDVGCLGGCAEGEYCLRQLCSDSHELLLLQGEAVTVQGKLQRTYPTELGDLDLVLVVDSDLSADDIASAESAASSFASELGRVAGLIGMAGSSDLTDFNGDGRLYIVVTNKTAGALGPDTIGWFNPHDWSSDADSNGADILWLRPGGVDSLAQQVGTLIHEYFHLALFSKRSAEGASEPEALWLDEAMAHALEDFSGWGSSNVVTLEEGLAGFSETALASGDDTLAQRGIGYTFIRHLVDARARDSGLTSADDSRISDSVEWLYSNVMNSTARGWNHAPLSALTDASIRGWLESVLGASGGYLEVGTSAAGQSIGLDPYGQYASAEGFDVYLEGPQFEDLGALDGAYEGFVPESGWNVLQVSGLEPGTYTPALEMSSGREGVLVIMPGGLE